MALFSECMLKCARKLLDTADIVREAMLQQQSRGRLRDSGHFDSPDLLSRTLAQNLIGSCEHFQQGCGIRIGSGASCKQRTNVFG
jgi:hypothetical protein